MSKDAQSRPARKTSPETDESKAAGKKSSNGAALVTLKQLAAELAESHDLPKKTAGAVLDGMVSLVVQRLKNGERIRIGGLGTLEVKEHPARTGRNPSTGEPIQIKASKKVAFRAAKELRDAV